VTHSIPQRDREHIRHTFVCQTDSERVCTTSLAIWADSSGFLWASTKTTRLILRCSITSARGQLPVPGIIKIYLPRYIHQNIGKKRYGYRPVHINIRKMSNFCFHEPFLNINSLPPPYTPIETSLERLKLRLQWRVLHLPHLIDPHPIVLSTTRRLNSAWQCLHLASELTLVINACPNEPCL
jgi:hypothetical protein